MLHRFTVMTCAVECVLWPPLRNLSNIPLRCYRWVVKARAADCFLPYATPRRRHAVSSASPASDIRNNPGAEQASSTPSRRRPHVLDSPAPRIARPRFRTLAVLQQVTRHRLECPLSPVELSSGFPFSPRVYQAHAKLSNWGVHSLVPPRCTE